jgi:hypothetical protein
MPVICVTPNDGPPKCLACQPRPSIRSGIVTKSETRLMGIADQINPLSKGQPPINQTPNKTDRPDRRRDGLAASPNSCSALAASLPCGTHHRSNKTRAGDLGRVLPTHPASPQAAFLKTEPRAARPECPHRATGEDQHRLCPEHRTISRPGVAFAPARRVKLRPAARCGAKDRASAGGQCSISRRPRPSAVAWLAPHLPHSRIPINRVRS